jgi:hypothetical protein
MFDLVSRQAIGVRVKRCQSRRPMKSGSSDCPSAGRANASRTAAVASIAIGVLVMRWLQVSTEFRPSVAESRPISYSRLRICSRNRGGLFCRGTSAMLTLDPLSEAQGHRRLSLGRSRASLASSTEPVGCQKAPKASAAISASRDSEQPLPILLAHLGRGLVHLREERFGDAAAWLEPALSFSHKPSLRAGGEHSGRRSGALGWAWVGLQKPCRCSRKSSPTAPRRGVAAMCFARFTSRKLILLPSEFRSRPRWPMRPTHSHARTVSGGMRHTLSCSSLN